MHFLFKLIAIKNKVWIDDMKGFLDFGLNIFNLIYYLSRQKKL